MQEFGVVDYNDKQLGIIAVVGPLAEQFLFATDRAAPERIRQASGKLAEVIRSVYQTQPPLVLRLSDKTAEQGGFTTAVRWVSRSRRCISVVPA